MHAALVQIAARTLPKAWKSIVLGYVRFVVTAPVKIALIVDDIELFRRRPVLRDQGLAGFATKVFR